MNTCTIVSFPRILRVDLQRTALYECGATILAALTFPGPHDMQRRLEQRRGLRNYALNKMLAAGTFGGANRSDLEYLAETLDEQRQAVAATEEVWDRRLTAGQYAMLHAKQAFGQFPAQRKPWHLPSDIQSAADSILQECDKWLDTPSTIDDRIWRESEPVIHIACAICVMTELTWWGGIPMDIDALLTEVSDPFFIKAIVNLSKQYLDLLSTCAALDLDPGRLIRLVPYIGARSLAAFAM